MKTFWILIYVVIIAITTIIFGVIYACVQQSYRTGANDPQVQMVNNIITKLQNGKSIDNFFSDTIDISKSLSTFIALYDSTGSPLRSSGILNGKAPELPSGLFDFTKSLGEHRVTWQPERGVRMAVVIISTNSSPVGYIAAGRSLKEVEMREHNLVTMIFFGWIICIGMILMFGLLQFYLKNKMDKK